MLVTSILSFSHKLVYLIKDTFHNFFTHANCDQAYNLISVVFMQIGEF